MPKFEDKPPYRWRTVKIFISSTFRDFHAERDYLVKYVFPYLRQWCEIYKLHLVDIDLRWGVTKQEAESGKVIDICLDLIDGSRPFFISMLGNRYGWVPDLKDASIDTRECYDRLEGKKDFSITHLEIHHAVIDSLRSVDVLVNVPHAFFYFRDETCLPEKGEMTDWKKEELFEYKCAFFETDQKYKNRLKNLKQSIEKHYEEKNEISDRLFKYKPIFVKELINPEDKKLKGRFTVESLKDFGERVKNDLEKAIGKQFKERIKDLEEKRKEDTLETELDFHEAFVENRTQLFIGRTIPLEKLQDYKNSNSQKILAVYGKPGSGKSALLAQFYKKLKESFGDKSKTLLIPHFIGASPASSSLPRMLTRFCEILKKQFNMKEEIPTDINKLAQVFKELLSTVAEPILFIIDGLNQLDGNNRAHDLDWLPCEIPDNVKIIASTLEGDTKDALEKKTEENIDVKALNDNEKVEIIRGMPSVFAKTLEEKHIKLLLKKKATSNPLYLKVALEELRIFGSFERLAEKINEFPDDVEDLFIYMVERLEQDYKSYPGLVERLFCLLECSRYGLTDHELMELMDGEKKYNIHQGILRQIRCFLQRRGDVIDFFHRSLSKAVRKKYFSGNEQLYVKWHIIITNYFMPLWQKPYLRAIEELPYHLTNSEDWRGAKCLLTNLEFIEAKSLAERVNDLIFDYQFFLKAYAKCNKDKINDRSNNDFANRNHSYSIDNGSLGEICNFNSFVIYSRNDLIRFGNRPNFTLQNAYNYYNKNIHNAARNILNGREISHGWISWDNRGKSKRDDSLLFSIEPKTGNFLTMTLLPGSHSAVDLIATIDTGGNFILWNSKTGVPVSEIITPPISDSAMAVFGSNRNILLFEPSKLTCLDFNMKTIWVEKNLPHEIPTALAVFQHSEFVLIGTQNKKIYIWNIKNHQMHGEIGPFKTYPKVILPSLQENTAWIGFSSMGRKHNDIIKLTINDIINYERIGSHDWTLYDLMLSGDDKGILSVGWDGKLKKWGQSGNSFLHTEVSLPNYVKPTSCAMVKEVDTIICGDNKGDLWVSSSVSEEWKRYPACHEGIIINIKTFGLNRVLTLGKDNLIRFWNLSNDPLELSEIRVSKRITDIVTTEDQKKIFWASNSEKGEFGCFHKVGGKYKPHSFTLSAEGPIEKILSTSGEDYILLITNRGTCRIMRITISGNINVTEKATFVLKEEDSAVDLTPDGRFLLANASQEIYDLLSGSIVKKIDGILREKHHYLGRIESSSQCEFAKQGNYAISIFKAPYNEENTNTAVYLISLERGKAFMLRKYSFRLRSLSIHPNFEAVVISGDNGYIEIINLPDGKLEKTLKGHKGDVNSTRWTLDGQYIISAGNDKTIRVWNVKSGDEMIVHCLKAPVTCISNVNAFGQFACGDSSGGIYLLSIHGIPFASPYVTAVRKWQIESSETPLYDYPYEEELRGKYESEVSFNCPYCRKRINTTNDMFGENIICPVCENTKPIQLVLSEGLDIIE